LGAAPAAIARQDVIPRSQPRGFVTTNITVQPVGANVQRDAEAGPDSFVFVTHDGFDGEPGLNRKPLWPDPWHVSLAKPPEAFTIHVDVEWGNGSPRQCECLAKNSGKKDISEFDVVFR